MNRFKIAAVFYIGMVIGLAGMTIEQYYAGIRRMWNFRTGTSPTS